MGIVATITESVKTPIHPKHEHLFPIISIAAATTLIYSSCRLFSSFQQKKEREKQGIKEIPMPGGCYPFVGHLFSTGKSYAKTVEQWHKELGPIFQLKMGNQTWISISDPVLAHKVFASNGAVASSRPYTTFSHQFHSNGGKNIAFAQPSENWKNYRAAVMSTLQQKGIDKFKDSILEETSKLTQRLICYTKKDGSVNPLLHLKLNFVNVIFNAGFGKKFNTVDDPEFLSVAKMAELSTLYLDPQKDYLGLLPVLSLVDWFVGTREKFNKFVNSNRNPMYEQFIKEAEGSNQHNLVKALEEENRDLSTQERLAFMSELITAGTDAVSIAMSWMLAILCCHPEVQSKVHIELDQFIAKHGCLPTLEDRLETPYCFSTIRECMRYRPITPSGIAHSLDKDIEVDGYILPKGSAVNTSMKAIHRNPNHYSTYDPEKFYPERFLNNTKAMSSSANGKIEERDHFNFGWGRRICAGMHLAEVEIYSSFVHIFSNCTLEPVSEAEVPDIEGVCYGGMMNIPPPHKIKFIKRENKMLSDI